MQRDMKKLQVSANISRFILEMIQDRVIGTMEDEQERGNRTQALEWYQFHRS